MNTRLSPTVHYLVQGCRAHTPPCSAIVPFWSAVPSCRHCCPLPYPRHLYIPAPHKNADVIVSHLLQPPQTRTLWLTIVFKWDSWQWSGYCVVSWLSVNPGCVPRVVPPIRCFWSRWLHVLPSSGCGCLTMILNPLLLNREQIPESLTSFINNCDKCCLLSRVNTTGIIN